MSLVEKDLIPHVRLTLGEAEIEAATAVLRSGHLAMGPVAIELERALAASAGVGDAATVSSGTAGLHLALLALRVGPGDEVVVPDYACQALLHAVRATGAEVRLADINLDTFTLDPASAKQAVTTKTKAVIVPHMFGLMADMPALRALGLPIIEDCAFGLGATLQGKPAGSFGDLSIFSFYATKIIAGGEGGAVASSNRELVETVRNLREYDKKTDYTLRFNYKLSDLNAAIALAQLGQLEKFLERRARIAARYTEALGGGKFVLPVVPEGYTHAFARYVLRADNGDKLREHLRAQGIGAGKGVAVALHQLVQGAGSFSASEEALRTAVSIPIYPTLTEAEQERIITSLLAY